MKKLIKDKAVSEHWGSSDTRAEFEEPSVKERKMKKCAETESVGAKKHEFVC